MREIKFRAWDKELNRMCDVIQLGVRDIIVNSIEEDEISGFLPIDRFEIMQYTGLKDKNGTEIYEGDIIRTHENRIQKVIWHNNGFKLEYKFKRSYRGESYWETRKDIELSETNNKRWGIKVIGNIYENPELLKEGE